MSDKVLKMVNIQISHKFASMEDAQVVVNKLVEYIRYTCKTKHYFCQGISGVSNIKSNSVETMVTENIKEQA